MFEDWDVQTRIQDLLALLIRAKRYNKSKKIKCTNGWLEELLNLFIYSTVQLIRSIISFINTLQHYYHANSLRGSAQNIREHYDLGNDMFSIFLDPSMTYSCATFQSIPHTVTHSDNELLEEAQMRKYDQIFDELNLKSNDRILEIGCGWGACAIRAVKCYGCQWTGLTISTEQFKIAQQRITDNGVADKVNIKLLDYRLEKDIYDKVIVIEMIEAVGHEYLPQFFETLRDRLCPGEALPPELTIKKTVHIGQHYGPTLDLWYCAWMEHEERILKLGYSKKFHRKWQYYFQLCSTLFRYSYIDTVQLLIEKSL
uniref:Cyclopropane-fatty-acyl-phospholipid synthase n=1 Tax=Setaria digitata TaxID=48799 RepID=A0A915PHJ6_9BILA